MAPSDTSKKEAYLKVLIKSARTTQGSSKASIYREAVNLAQGIARQSPSYDNLLTLGEVQLGAKDYAGATSSFQQAATKNSSDWLVHYYLGQAQTSTGNYQAAENTLRTALGKASSNDQRKVWGQIGFVNEKLKNFPAAKDAYQKAGNQAGLNRVAENQRIADENKGIEAENKKIEQMEAERKKLEEELKNLPGGRPPR